MGGSQSWERMREKGVILGDAFVLARDRVEINVNLNHKCSPGEIQSEWCNVFPIYPTGVGIIRSREIDGRVEKLMYTVIAEEIGQ